MKKKLKLSLLFLFVIQFSACGEKPIVKQLKLINDDYARFWIEIIEKHGVDAIVDDTTILRESVKANNIELVKACIKSGADVDRRASKKFYTPVFLALKNGSYEIVEALLKAKASMYITMESDSYDLLFLAMRQKDKTAIDIVLNYYDEKKLDYRQTNISLTDTNPSWDTLYTLQQRGYKPTIRDIDYMIDKYETFHASYRNGVNEPSELFSKAQMIAEYLKDSYYIKNHPNYPLLANEFNSILRRIRGYEMLQILFDAGFKPVLPHKDSPADFIMQRVEYYFDDNTIIYGDEKVSFEDITTAVSFFIKNKVNFNTPMNVLELYDRKREKGILCEYLAEMLLTKVHTYSGYYIAWGNRIDYSETNANRDKEKFQKAKELLDYALSQGVNTIRNQSFFISVAEEFGYIDKLNVVN